MRDARAMFDGEIVLLQNKRPARMLPYQIGPSAQPCQRHMISDKTEMTMLQVKRKCAHTPHSCHHFPLK
jgi:hypothetical protein